MEKSTFLKDFVQPGGLLGNLEGETKYEATQRDRDKRSRKALNLRFAHDDGLDFAGRPLAAPPPSLAHRVQGSLAPTAANFWQQTVKRAGARGLGAAHVAEVFVWPLAAIPVRGLVGPARRHLGEPIAAVCILVGLGLSIYGTAHLGHTVHQAPPSAWPVVVLLSTAAVYKALQQDVPTLLMAPFLLAGGACSLGLQFKEYLPAELVGAGK